MFYFFRFLLNSLLVLIINTRWQLNLRESPNLAKLYVHVRYFKNYQVSMLKTKKFLGLPSALPRGTELDICFLFILHFSLKENKLIQYKSVRLLNNSPNTSLFGNLK